MQICVSDLCCIYMYMYMYIHITERSLVFSLKNASSVPLYIVMSSHQPWRSPWTVCCPQLNKCVVFLLTGNCVVVSLVTGLATATVWQLLSLSSWACWGLIASTSATPPLVYTTYIHSIHCICSTSICSSHVSLV